MISASTSESINHVDETRKGVKKDPRLFSSVEKDTHIH